MHGIDLTADFVSSLAVRCTQAANSLQMPAGHHEQMIAGYASPLRGDHAFDLLPLALDNIAVHIVLPPCLVMLPVIPDFVISIPQWRLISAGSILVLVPDAALVKPDGKTSYDGDTDWFHGMSFKVVEL